MRRCEEGYTLTELVMVIVILGILTAVALPRFVDLRGDASAAAREGVKAALNSGIQIVHSRWLAAGMGTNSTVILDGGGPGIIANASGYPAVGGASYDSAAECATLVQGLLGGPLPSTAVTCTGVTVPLRTAFSVAVCQVHACPTDFATPITVSATYAS